jgi:hypothetical protein
MTSLADFVAVFFACLAVLGGLRVLVFLIWPGGEDD